MKKQDMEQAIRNATPVAVRPRFKRNGRAVILALGAERRVYSGTRADFGGHPAYDGVRVRYLDGEREEIVVGPRDVLATWADYEASQAKAAMAEELREARLADELDRAARLCAHLGAGKVKRFYEGFKTSGYGVELDAAQVAVLLGSAPRSDCPSVADLSTPAAGVLPVH